MRCHGQQAWHGAPLVPNTATGFLRCTSNPSHLACTRPPPRPPRGVNRSTRYAGLSRQPEAVRQQRCLSARPARIRGSMADGLPPGQADVPGGSTHLPQPYQAGAVMPVGRLALSAQAAQAQYLAMAALHAGPGESAPGQPLVGIGAICRYGRG